MRFQIEFDADNAAFEEDPNAECARIVRHVATCLQNGAIGGALFDANGNRVGTWGLERTEAEKA